MFDVGFSEIVLIGIVALLVTDPKDLPALMFKAGRFFRQFKLIMSRVSNTIGDVMHELEVENYRQDYKAKHPVIDTEQIADEKIEMLPLPQAAPVDVAGCDPVAVAPVTTHD